MLDIFRNRRHRHSLMTSPRLLQADTTLTAGSEIQWMVRGTKRMRQEGQEARVDGGPRGWQKLGKSPSFER